MLANFHRSFSKNKFPCAEHFFANQAFYLGLLAIFYYNANPLINFLKKSHFLYTVIQTGCKPVLQKVIWFTASQWLGCTGINDHMSYNIFSFNKINSYFTHLIIFVQQGLKKDSTRKKLDLFATFQIWEINSTEVVHFYFFLKFKFVLSISGFVIWAIPTIC